MQHKSIDVGLSTVIPHHVVNTKFSRYVIQMALVLSVNSSITTWAWSFTS